MSTDNPLHRPIASALSVPLYIGSTAVALILVGVVGVFLLLATTDMQSLVGADPEEVTAQLITPGFLGTFTVVQGLIMVALAALFAMITGRTMKVAFAIRNAPAIVWVLAILGGLLVGHPMGWVAERLMEWLPQLSTGSLEMIGGVMGTDSIGGKIIVAFAIAVVAPISEELVFRGWMWDAIDRAAPTWITLLLTSLIFAGYHMDPIHVIGVSVTGLFLGWIRILGGSIWPCIATHAANNALATAAGFWMSDLPDAHTPWWFALITTVLSLGLVAVGVAWQRTRRAAPVA